MKTNQRGIYATEVAVILALIILGGFIGISGIKAVKDRVTRAERKVKDEVQKACEYAYFEGQRDALTGDIRIVFDEQEKTWSWSKSPWDSGLEPKFDPSVSIAPDLFRKP